MEKKRPPSYDITFCTSVSCKNPCYRHHTMCIFEPGRLYSMADFNCEERINKKKHKK